MRDGVIWYDPHQRIWFVHYRTDARWYDDGEFETFEQACESIRKWIENTGNEREV